MSADIPAERKRLRWLDGWRGLAVLTMIGWHFRWDLGLLEVLPQAPMFAQPAVAVRYFIICSFTFLSGVSARLTRNGVRRGLVTLGCAAAVSLVTWLAGDPAWFGALHLMGCCMVLYGLWGKHLQRLPELPALGAYLALFLLFHSICYGVRISVPGLWMFGFRTPTFYSSDYYPLLPWGFLFLAGTVIGGRASAWDLPAPGFLTWIGRRALWIYMIHQPVLLGIAWLIARYR